jgi:hypothetical protein
VDWVEYIHSWIWASARWIQIRRKRLFVLSKGHVWDMDLRVCDGAGGIPDFDLR